MRKQCGIDFGTYATQKYKQPNETRLKTALEALEKKLEIQRKK